MSKVVLDTNVLVSALIKKEGKPAQILRHLDLTDADIDEYLARLRRASTLVQLQTRVDVVIDPDDNMFVACAIDGGAAYIVSGDPHLLDLHAYAGIQLLTPAAFLEVLQRADGE